MIPHPTTLPVNRLSLGAPCRLSLAMLVLGGAMFAMQAPFAATPAATAPATPTAPAFTLPDAQGTPRSLADFKGKWIVLEWVNYDCPFVKKHYGSGHMQALQKELRGQGLVWLSINSSADGKQGSFRGQALTRRMQDEKAAPDHYLVDADGKVGKSYGAKTTPTLVLIDPQGAIAYQGAIDDRPSTDADDIPQSRNYLREAVTQALAGKPITIASTKSYGCSVKYAD